MKKGEEARVRSTIQSDASDPVCAQSSNATVPPKSNVSDHVYAELSNVTGSTNSDASDPVCAQSSKATVPHKSNVSDVFTVSTVFDKDLTQTESIIMDPTDHRSSDSAIAGTSTDCKSDCCIDKAYHPSFNDIKSTSAKQITGKAGDIKQMLCPLSIFNGNPWLTYCRTKGKIACFTVAGITKALISTESYGTLMAIESILIKASNQKDFCCDEVQTLKLLYDMDVNFDNLVCELLLLPQLLKQFYPVLKCVSSIETLVTFFTENSSKCVSILPNVKRLLEIYLLAPMTSASVKNKIRLAKQHD